MPSAGAGSSYDGGISSQRPHIGREQRSERQQQAGVEWTSDGSKDAGGATTILGPQAQSDGLGWESKDKGKGKSEGKGTGKGKGKGTANVNCFGCGQSGHFASQCWNASVLEEPEEVKTAEELQIDWSIPWEQIVDLSPEDEGLSAEFSAGSGRDGKSDGGRNSCQVQNP
eukprot:TRINITY_DN14583_c0_g1_i1.p1 TRINITY_DN14583_c0_g1~~TRINITY_DN14583_c0_g1_i1.p1  ORF type:complete len:170 (+),score=29.72 TRINITY_DN14583_c0_g1_i1:318-827(+)